MLQQTTFTMHGVIVSGDARYFGNVFIENATTCL